MRRMGVLIVCLSLSASCFLGRAGEKKDDLAEMEKKLLELTNAEREKEDLKPLRWNAVLGKAARGHAENMAKQKKDAHVLDGKKPSDRVKAAGYDYSRTGENIGSMTPGFELSLLMKAWMGSEGHRANIMQPEFVDAGMGAARDEEGRLYFAQVFGAPRKR